MAKTKSKKDTQLNAQELLEARVDAMMDPNAKLGAPALPPKTVVQPKAPVVAEPKAAAPQPAPEPVPAPEPAGDDVQVPPLNIDSPASDAAIADIVAQEADQVLAAEDAGVAAAKIDADAAVAQVPKRHKHPLFWFFVTLLAVVAVIIVVLLVNPNLTPSFGP